MVKSINFGKSRREKSGKKEGKRGKKQERRNE
jgi:hypothetical protein